MTTDKLANHNMMSYGGQEVMGVARVEGPIVAVSYTHLTLPTKRIV